jgi:hypothetical protein
MYAVLDAVTLADLMVDFLQYKEHMRWLSLVPRG